ncbi:MAG: sulfotransferase domain-containing protein [Verrucomicrobiota bacterium]
MDLEQSEAPPANLKILVVSTPKTGNTWLKYLLATIYDLPMVDFPMPEFWRDFDPDRYDKLGPRWIAHQHFPPRESFIRWAKEQGVILITTVRHPGDCLVSMYFYVQNFAGSAVIDPEAVRLLLSPDNGTSDLHLLPLTNNLELYVRSKFFSSLNYSIAWLHSGLTFGVRYEDLWHSPASTLRALTNKIHLVSMGTIQTAVERCQIDKLRHKAGAHVSFYRAGGVGAWTTSLPSRIIRLFQTLPPYPAQVKWLGYSFDTEDSALQFEEPKKSTGPFSCLCFDNGVKIDRLIAQIYFYRFAVQQNHDSSRLGATLEGDNFYTWLNAAAESDPYSGRQIPVVTNVGAYLHQGRPDLQRAFPDLYRRHRAAFSHWFVLHASVEYPLLDTRFPAGVCESWVKGPAPNFSPVHYGAEITRKGEAIAPGKTALR